MNHCIAVGPAPQHSACRGHAGQSLVEWTLLVALMAVTCAASLSTLGQGVSQATENVGMALNAGEGYGYEGPDGPPPPCPEPCDPGEPLPMEDEPPPAEP